MGVPKGTFSLQSRSLYRVLAGAIFGFLFFALLSISSGFLVGHIYDWEEQCSRNAIQQLHSGINYSYDDCYPASHIVAISYLSTLTYGPAILFGLIYPFATEFLRANVFTISSTIFAILGGVCLGFLNYKKGIIAFLLVYFGLSLPIAFLAYALWVTG
jgi:ABC-type dipeptide/oligopeptide/nickel transport system permease subunit